MIQENFSLILFLLTFFSSFWKDKAPYEAKAAKRKAEYEKQIKAYNKKQVCLPFLMRDFILG